MALLSFLGALSCSGGATNAPAAGSERGPCYGNGTCNAGLTCLSELCVVSTSGTPTDAGSAVDAAVDAGLSDSGPADVGPLDTGAAPDSGPNDTGMMADAAMADAGPADTGVPDVGPNDVGPIDAGRADAGTVDSGVADAGRPDAGPNAMCNPVDGTGCGSDFCLWDPRVDHRSCGPSPGGLVLEQGCDESLQNCAPGFACLQTTGQNAPDCHRVCDVFTGGLSCQNLMGRHPIYNCSVINGSQQYGVCLGRGSYCEPLGAPCPATEVCSFGQGGQTTCATAGTTQRDQPCDINANCALNEGICTNLGSGSYCRLACNPAQMGSCGATARCTQLTGENFGVCLPTTCQPFTAPCPVGSVCSPSAGPIECRPEGTAAIGAGCSAAMECAAPGLCVDLGAGQRCEQPCDVNNPCTSPQACVNLIGFGFGVCR